MEDYKLIPLTQGKFAIVDPEDYDRLSQFKWYCSAGYARREAVIDGVTQNIAMHRIIANTPPGFVTDHINGDTLDNRRSNLRICTPKQNAFNKRRRKDGWTSKYKGVSHKLDSQKHRERPWMASIRGKLIGRFKTEEEAARCYDAAARFYFREFAVTNFEGEEALSIEDLRARIQEKVKSGYSSRFLGVYWHDQTQRWRGQVIHNSKQIHIGSFATQEEAAIARDQKVKELGVKTKLNFPD